MGRVEGACGSAFIWAEGAVPKVLQVHSVLVHLKHEWDLNHKVENACHSNGQLSRSPRVLQKGHIMGEAASLLSSYAAGSVLV